MSRQPIHTYVNGQPYRPAYGRDHERELVEDHFDFPHAVIDLGREQPSVETFLRKIEREFKIRKYVEGTSKTYLSRLRSFFNWFQYLPHEVVREDIKDFLEFIVDAEKGGLGVYISVFRNTFDKMCGNDVTLGLVTPRKSKYLPTVLSRDEVQQMISAADTLRDKLLIGLMYGAGVRVSEVVRLQARDFDFDRCEIRVRRGKGRKDRMVFLPKTFKPILQFVLEGKAPKGYVFPSPQNHFKHLSTRTAQRVVKRTATIANIRKKETPHALRHSFACHALENGMDIRYIQKQLGHAHLETTTIYTKLAKPNSEAARSPLDVSNGNINENPTKPSLPPVGKLRLHMRPHPDRDNLRKAQITIELRHAAYQQPIYLTGTVATERRPGWLCVDVPESSHWQPILQRLPRHIRDRVTSPEFYRTLVSGIEQRFVQLTW